MYNTFYCDKIILCFAKRKDLNHVMQHNAIYELHSMYDF